MRPQKVQDIEMLQGLMSVLRAKGYDGASLNDLAEAVGLKKASLYHRFPGGKKEMTSAVLQFVEEWVDKNIYQVLIDDTLEPQKRVLKAIENISILYANGEAICILRSLSMETGLELFGEQIKNSMARWVEAFAKLGLAQGMSQDVAQQQALQSLIDVQGSLVVAKGMNSTAIFRSTLQGIQRRYN